MRGPFVLQAVEWGTSRGTDNASTHPPTMGERNVEDMGKRLKNVILPTYVQVILYIY